MRVMEGPNLENISNGECVDLVTLPTFDCLRTPMLFETGDEGRVCIANP